MNKEQLSIKQNKQFSSKILYLLYFISGKALYFSFKSHHKFCTTIDHFFLTIYMLKRR